MNTLKQAGIFLLDLIFPRFCFGCSQIGSYFCNSCRAVTPYQLTQRCIVCQKPALEGFTHPKCTGKYKPDRLVSIYDYRTRPITDLIITGKYQFIPEIYQTLGKQLNEYIFRSPVPADNFTVCPIPLNKRRQRWRGFNQSAVIASCLSMPSDYLLARSKHTKTQKDLNKLQRLRNLKNAFQYQTEFVPDKVILVDDVTTTGTTFLEGTAALKRVGVKQVWCFAIAQD